MERSEEAELLQQIRSGNVHAFRALVEAHQVRAYATALRLMGSPELAEEMVQDAFVQAYHKLDQFRADASFGTWLHRILTRQCFSQLRRRGVSTTHLAEDAAAAAVPNQALPALEQADTKSQVQRVMSQLPPKSAWCCSFFTWRSGASRRFGRRPAGRFLTSRPCYTGRASASGASCHPPKCPPRSNITTTPELWAIFANQLHFFPSPHGPSIFPSR